MNSDAEDPQTPDPAQANRYQREARLGTDPPAPLPNSTPPAFDPAGPPQPVASQPWLPSLTVLLASASAAGMALFGLLAVTERPCMGATRSSRLKWEQQAKQAEAELEAIRQQNAETGTADASDSFVSSASVKPSDHEEQSP